MRATAATQHRRTTARTLDDLAASIADEQFVVLDLDDLTDEVSNAMELHRSLTTTRQGLVIKRLTVISALLLPSTFVTGFFGMNFGWLDEHIGSGVGFWLLGVLIPVAVVLGAMWRAGWLVVLQRDPAPTPPAVRSSGR